MTQFTSHRGNNSPTTKTEVLLDTRKAVFDDPKNTQGGVTRVEGDLVVKVHPVGNTGTYNLFVNGEKVLAGYRDEKKFDAATEATLIERGLKKKPVKK